MYIVEDKKTASGELIGIDLTDAALRNESSGCAAHISLAQGGEEAQLKDADIIYARGWEAAINARDLLNIGKRIILICDESYSSVMDYASNAPGIFMTLVNVFRNADEIIYETLPESVLTLLKGARRTAFCASNPSALKLSHLLVQLTARSGEQWRTHDQAASALFRLLKELPHAMPAGAGNG